MLLSMTIPESLRGQVMVDGKRVRLSPCEHALVSLLMTTPPETVVDVDTIIETVWPNPDTQPLTAQKIISVLRYKLRLKGIEITTCWGRGLYSFPAECRGRPARERVPTFIDDDATDYSWVRLAA